MLRTRSQCYNNKGSSNNNNNNNNNKEGNAIKEY